MKSKSRRKFLQDSVGLSAAGSVLLTSNSLMAGTAASNSRVLGANDRIRIALIGCGGMGRGDLKDFLRVKNVECVALCDVDDEQSGKALKATEEQVSQHPALVTRDFRKVLDQKDLDAVIVATPDHWHALPTVMACQAGKDVYVEKPLSVSIGEGRIMVETARRYNRVVQMGTQQRSSPHYSEAVDYVKGGKLGKGSAGSSLGLPGLERKNARAPRWRSSRVRRLRHVVGPGEETAVQSKPLPFQVPLVLGLLWRIDDRLGRAHDRHRQLGHGYQGSEFSRLSRREIRISG